MLSRAKIASVARPAAAASALPPKVEAWVPGARPASALADDERFARFLPGDERYWRVVRG